MRILVLQLARFGDIYQSWPTFRALKRSYPECELHVLVRQRFREAADFPGLAVHALPTTEILRPIFEGQSEDAANSQLLAFLEPLRDIKFDRIINLSFSPVSSYITDFLKGETSEVFGYTRHSDGHFHIPDDSSAYFYAQVGIGRANRYHVTELFAAVAGVDLEESDFLAPGLKPVALHRGVVIHLGASSQEKTYLPELWVEVMRRLQVPEITLIGSSAERGLSETVASQCLSLSATKITNRVGQTTLHDLFEIIQSAELLIGADSAPVHMASLTGTRVLNLSSIKVNFWETGPLTPGSRILFKPNLDQLSPQSVAQEAAAILANQDSNQPCIVRDGRLEPYRVCGLPFETFAWELTEALYTGSPYPQMRNSQDRLAFQRLFELAELALQQLERWSDAKTRPVAAEILAQVDTMMGDVGKLNARVNPVVQWFETERLRIPPGSDQETLERTTKAFHDLYLVAAVYRHYGDVGEVTRNAIALCRKCVPEIREYNLPAVSGEFQDLISTLHELARHSTKVAAPGWSSVLDELNQSLEKRDYIQAADFLEWKMIPVLEGRLNEQETLSQDVIS